MYASEHRDASVPGTASPTGPAEDPFGIVVVAASFGGLAALRQLLPALPPDFPAPVVVVQHRAAMAGDPLPAILRYRCELPVLAAEDGAPPPRGAVTVLPADRHASLRVEGHLELGPPGSPRADALLSGAAACHGSRTLAVILTGRLSDGAQGTREVKRAGGMVLVQDPDECPAAGMPSAALATGCVDHSLPLAVLGPALVALAMAPGAAQMLRVPPAPWARLTFRQPDALGA